MQYFNDGFFAVRFVFLQIIPLLQFQLWINAELGNVVQEMCRKYPDFDFYVSIVVFSDWMRPSDHWPFPRRSTGCYRFRLHRFQWCTPFKQVHFYSIKLSIPISLYSRVILYTFGQPRIGDAQFTRHLGTSVRCFDLCNEILNNMQSGCLSDRSQQRHGTALSFPINGISTP